MQVFKQWSWDNLIFPLFRYLEGFWFILQVLMWKAGFEAGTLQKEGFSCLFGGFFFFFFLSSPRLASYRMNNAMLVIETVSCQKHGLLSYWFKATVEACFPNAYKASNVNKKTNNKTKQQKKNKACTYNIYTTNLSRYLEILPCKP